MSPTLIGVKSAGVIVMCGEGLWGWSAESEREKAVQEAKCFGVNNTHGTPKNTERAQSALDY